MEDKARILEDRVEDLTRAIAQTINDADVPERPEIRAELKEFAISLLQESIQRPEPVAVAAVGSGKTAFNPLAMGIPLFFAGGVLIFLFPPVGMMLFAASVVMVVWGFVTSMVTRR
ncbi:MAG: hypothetical protein HY271_01880 [Deltaproteobacteria bacterium]|nr:hypothetical protein [Deltaproteobacteria bacterium]